MRRIVFSVAALLVVAFAASAMQAASIDMSDEIDLGPSPLGALHFSIASGGDFNLSIFNLHGKAAGIGTLASSGPYTLVEQGGTSIVGTPINGCTKASLTCEFGVAQNKPVLFSYGKSGSLLTADVTFQDLTETAITQGNVNDELLVNLTNFGGTLGKQFVADGVLQMSILFNIRTTGIYNLVGVQPGKTIFASVKTGQINPVIAPQLVPEPAELSLMGAGLLGLGLVLRKRLQTGRQSVSNPGREF